MVRLFHTAFLVLCIALTGIASAMAETRMTAAGVFCGFGEEVILLDAQGLPILDGEGDVIAAPDCLACHLSVALSASTQDADRTPVLIASVEPPEAASLLSRIVPQGAWARAPPVWA